MHINVTGHHIELTEALRNYVQEKFSRFERHSDSITKCNVILSVEDKRQKAEITLQIAHAEDLHAEVTTEDMYASIDALVDKMDRMLLKLKEKNLDSKRQPREPIYES